MSAKTPEYFNYRLEQETEQYKQEIERLNNIINEIEKYIGIKMNSFGICNAGDIYWKLQELKGENSNEN